MISINMIEKFKPDVFLKCQDIRDCKHSVKIVLKDGKTKTIILDGASIFLIQAALKEDYHNKTYAYIIGNAQKNFFFPNIKFLAEEILSNIFKDT